MGIKERRLVIWQIIEKCIFSCATQWSGPLEVMESDSESGATLCRGQALLMEGMQACEDIYVETEG